MVRKASALLIVVVMTFTLVATLSAPAAEATAPTSSSSALYQLTNASRAGDGRAPLGWDQNLANTSQVWANYMAATGDFRHDPNLGAAVRGSVPNPNGWGENIASAPRSWSPAAIQDLFMNSTGHRNNIVSPTWDRVGIAFAVAANGQIYTVVRFAVSPDKAALGQPVGSFDNATSPAPNQLRVSGWALDPDSTGALQIDVTVDGVPHSSHLANIGRADVGTTFPGFGNDHGFDRTLTVAGGATRSVCIQARNLAGYGTTQSLGCRTVFILPDSSGPFYDVGATHPFAADIQWLVDRNITTGYTDGTFHPNENITRQAMAAFLWRYAGEPDPAPDAPTFADVAPSNPFAVAIRWMGGAGITTGYTDGTFHPNEEITRQAVASFLWRYADRPDPAADAPTFADVPDSNPFAVAIRWMAGSGITTGYTDGFHPNENLTRQAMAAFLHRLAVLPR